MASKVRIVIFFIALVFAIYFGIQLFGPDGSIGQYQTAVEERDKAAQELDEANKELELAQKNLREVTS